MISSTIFRKPSISSSGVIPAKFILQLTYVGTFVLRAIILPSLVAYSILEPDDTKIVFNMSLSFLSWQRRQLGVSCIMYTIDIHLAWRRQSFLVVPVTQKLRQYLR